MVFYILTRQDMLNASLSTGLFALVLLEATFTHFIFLFAIVRLLKMQSFVVVIVVYRVYF